MTRALLIGVALGAFALVGCGDDGDETGGGEDATTGAAATALSDCPDFESAAGTVSEVKANVECASVEPLASDVLSRDDCVEETPSPPNTCESRGYQCETTIEAGSGGGFVISCVAGSDRVEFVNRFESQPPPG